ncbi:hypothetical protein NRP21_19265 [Roseomonas pecuniae]|uniref:Uncharacterized protein n=2 Tax=Roseomonas populi TaxID=3121582 RepID=A0ABT1X7X0_9PROT|nr:hypothetical protein [Roseomonas pecuniae]
MPGVLVLALLAAEVVAGGQAAAATGGHGGDQLLPLVPRGAGQAGSCTRNRRWCVLLDEPDEGGAVRPVVSAGGAVRAAPPPPAEEPSTEESYAVWPALVTLRDGGFLAGVQVRTGTSYSGGGGSATELRIFHVSSDGTVAAEPSLSVPLQGSLMIRACFSERDMQRRRGACHDEYGFSARIGLAPGAAASLPILTYTTEAWTFPRGVSRSADSTRMPPLRPGDLVRHRDPACSFTRRFRFNAAAAAYRPDTALPECSDYTVP